MRAPAYRACRRADSDRRGITVLEVLVVAAIVGLLVALLLPGMQEARAIARRTVCANNLHIIGVAYHNYLEIKTTHRAGANGVRSLEWVNSLFPYVEYVSPMFRCPDDDDPKSAIGAMPSLLVNNTGMIIPLDATHPRVRYSPPGTPGANALTSGAYSPNAYALDIEDSTDWDYNDLILVLDPIGVDLFVYVVSKNAGFTFNLLDGQGNVLGSNVVPGYDEVLLREALSYGMQNHSHFMAGISPGTILIVEYYKQQANVVGMDGDLTEWPKWNAFRHHGNRMNVLYEDGHVAVGVEQEIDPRLPEVYDALWLPHVDPER